MVARALNDRARATEAKYDGAWPCCDKKKSLQSQRVLIQNDSTCTGKCQVGQSWRNSASDASPRSSEAKPPHSASALSVNPNWDRIILSPPKPLKFVEGPGVCDTTGGGDNCSRASVHSTRWRTAAQHPQDQSPGRCLAIAPSAASSDGTGKYSSKAWANPRSQHRNRLTWRGTLLIAAHQRANRDEWVRRTDWKSFYEFG